MASQIVNNTETAAEKYKESTVRLSVYFSIRAIASIVGFVGNLLSLIIIKRLKVRNNGHILMTYAAVSDIFLSINAPLQCFGLIVETDILDMDLEQWKVLCYVKELSLFLFMLGCVVSYVIISVDRYVQFFKSSL